MVRVRVRSRVPVPADLWGDMLAAQRLCLAQGMHCARLAELSSLQLMPADAGRWDACTELECLEAGATFAAHGGGTAGDLPSGVRWRVSRVSLSVLPRRCILYSGIWSALWQSNPGAAQARTTS